MVTAGPEEVEGAEEARASPSFPLGIALMSLMNSVAPLAPEFLLAVIGIPSRSHRSPLFLHKQVVGHNGLNFSPRLLWSGAGLHNASFPFEAQAPAFPIRCV